jgi:probable phosphoglycerate mutase
MTTFYLIRHGNTDFVGKVLAGRMPGIHLNAEGHEQAAQLAGRFRKIPVDAIFSSPLERARETAGPMSSALGIQVDISNEITEVEYGEWTGRAVSDLLASSLWQQYNSFRTGMHIPGGEGVLQLQSRVVGWLQAMREQRPAGRIAVVSHADPIKAALIYYLGLHLDMFHKFEISPASVSVLQLDESWSCVLTLNNLGDSL